MDGLKVTALVFFTIMFGLRAIFSFFEKDKKDITSRVQLYQQNREEKEEKESEVKQHRTLLMSIFRIFTPKKIIDQVESDLLQADIPLRAEELIMINIAIATFPAILIVYASRNIPLAIMIAGVGAYLPLLYVKSTKATRIRKFNDQLGDALTIMANSLRAGFSFLQTMDSLCKEMPAPLSTEFGRALREMRLGTTTEEALANMSKRLKSDDLDMIITAVNIQRQVGGNLAIVLDNIAATINERVRIKGEIKTLTAQGRISGTIVALLPVLLVALITVMNPSYILILVTHPLGLIMIGAAVVSEIIGVVAIKKIVNIDV